MLTYNATIQGGKGSLAVFFTDGTSKTLASTHPTYTEALTYLVATPAAEYDEDRVRDLVNPALRIGKMLQGVDPKYGYDLFTLSYDGIPLTGPLADLIKQRLNDGNSDWERFARFASSLERNPSFTAREGLYSWVKRNGLHILDDGRFVAHKGVGADGLSMHAGPNNFIDGVLLGQPGESVQVPHFVGTVVSKRRGDVDDSQVACSTGLHVGTHEYASTFGGADNRFLTVAVWPEDVVGGDQSFKIRVCRYEVLSLNESRAEFEAGDYVHVDRSDEISAFEMQHADQYPVRSRDHGFSEEDRAEYNSMPSVGRRLYDNLRTQFGKSHAAAFTAVFDIYGTHEEWLAKRDAERTAEAEEEAEIARLRKEAARVEAEQEAARVEAAPVLTGLAALAEAISDLKADLENTNLGHKPLARKWSSLTTESSVRRYRKAQGIQVSTWTKVKDALS